MSETKDLDDDKPRRNLLLASAIVVLMVWLNVPLDTVTERVLGVAGTKGVDPAKAWAAVLAVLAYLGHRYSYSEAAATTHDTLRLNWHNAVIAAAKRQATRHVVRAASTGQDSALFDNKLLAAFASEARLLNIDYSKGGRLWPNLPLFFKFEGLYQCTAHVGVGGEHHASGSVGSSGQNLEVNWTTVKQRIPLWGAAAIKVALRTNTTSTVIVPYALACAAAGSAGFQLASAAIGV